MCTEHSPWQKWWGCHDSCCSSCCQEISSEVWQLTMTSGLAPGLSSSRNDIGPPCHSACHPVVLSDVKSFFDVMTERQFSQAFELLLTREYALCWNEANPEMNVKAAQCEKTTSLNTNTFASAYTKTSLKIRFQTYFNLLLTPQSYFDMWYIDIKATTSCCMQFRKTKRICEDQEASQACLRMCASNPINKCVVDLSSCDASLNGYEN